MKIVFLTLLLIVCPDPDTVGSLATVTATEKRKMTLSGWLLGTTREKTTGWNFQKCRGRGWLSLESLEKSPSMNGAEVPRRSPRA